MPAKLTVEEFIRRSIEAHEVTFDYSEVHYNSLANKVKITCNKQHVFHQVANVHMRGMGCPFCNRKRMDTKTFIEASRAIHGNKYNYSKVIYSLSRNNVEISCDQGHTFKQTPNAHLEGHGCRKCATIVNAKRSTKTLDELLQQFKWRESEGFDYSRVNYITDNHKITLVCSKGHEFSQLPRAHMTGIGCPHCMTSGFSIGKSGALYLLIDVENSVVKVGITNRAVKTRCRDICKSSKQNFTISTYITFCEGLDAHLLEFEIIRDLKKNFKQVSEIFDGYTECFICSEAAAKEIINNNLIRYFNK